MNDVTKTVGGFRSAIQDLLVPELKALQVEIRNVRETLERHEKRLDHHDELLVKLVEEVRQLRADQGERFAALQKEMNERFVALQKEMNERFAAVMDMIGELQRNTSVILERLNYAERIHQIELKLERLAKAEGRVAETV